MRFFTVLGLSFLLWACGQPNSNTLSIGTISGPETELVETAKEVAEQEYGLHVKIIEFNDYNLPNEALEDGSLDANVYQHRPYLEAAMKGNGYDLEVLAKTFIYPTALYSSKYKSLARLPVGASIAVPNDPSNETRALLLLQTAGLITLHNSKNPTVQDILTNKKQFKFKELDAAQLPRVLADVDAAIINTTFALPAGLNPMKDALLTENKQSPYANLIVIKKNSSKKEQLLLFVKAFQSKAVKDKAKQLFGDAAVPAW